MGNGRTVRVPKCDEMMVIVMKLTMTPDSKTVILKYKTVAKSQGYERETQTHRHLHLHFYLIIPKLHHA